MKKKLLLVLPVDKSVVHFNAIAPPLGLGIIASLTPDDWDIEILDENFEIFYYKNVDLVGITSWTVNINRAYEIAEICKKNNTPVVMGGAHVSALPEEALNYCDYVVKGNAENVWQVFIDDFCNGTAKKIYYTEPNNRFVKPRHDLFHKNYILGAIQTTRGCPLDCEFCYVTQFNGFKYYRKDPDEVVSELVEIPQKFVFFIDDNLAGYTKKQEEDAIILFDKIIESKIKKYWYSQTSINFAKNELLFKKAVQSGCGSVLIGFEAETEEALKSINKHLNIKLDPSRYNEYIDLLQKHGIAVIAATIFSLENDTFDSMEKRIKFLCSTSAASITATFLTPFPGTRFFNRISNQNKLVYNNYPNDWKYYNCRFLTFKTNYSEDAVKYEKHVLKIILKAYNPFRLFYRALLTLYYTKNIIAVLHSYSANLKYKNFLKGKSNSYYGLRLFLTKLLLKNRTSNKSKA